MSLPTIAGIRAAATYYNLARYGSMAAKAGRYGSYGAGLYGGYRALTAQRQKLKGTGTIKFAPGKKRRVVTKRGYVASGEEGHTITKSKMVINKKPSKLQELLKEALPEVQRKVDTGNLFCTEGTQNFRSTNSGWNMNDLQAFAATGTATQKRFYVESFEYRNVFTNTTSTPITLKIYDLAVKQNIVDAGQAPDNLIKQGLSHKYNNSSQIGVPYMSPKESAMFTAYYKIDNQKTITLSPGETHEHYVFYPIQKYYNSDSVTTYGTNGTTPQTYLYAKGFTKICLIQIIGTPVTDGAQVSTAASKVIYMSHQKLTYRRPQGNSGTTLIATQLSVPPTNLTSEKFVNEDSGAATVNITI